MPYGSYDAPCQSWNCTSTSSQENGLSVGSGGVAQGRAAGLYPAVGTVYILGLLDPGHSQWWPSAGKEDKEDTGEECPLRHSQ